MCDIEPSHFDLDLCTAYIRATYGYNTTKLVPR